MDNLPDQLKLRYLRREVGVFLEINGARVPSSDAVSINLRRESEKISELQGKEGVSFKNHVIQCWMDYLVHIGKQWVWPSTALFFYLDLSYSLLAVLARTRKEKIVYCQGAGGDNHVPFIGGAGTIMSDNDYLSNSYPTLGLANYVSYDDGLDQRLHKFHKRDIAAPGVDILAAFTKFTTMTGSDSVKRVVKYNAESGNSMATPHVSGSVAYVKTYHLRYYEPNLEKINSVLEAGVYHQFITRAIQRIQLSKDFKDDEFWPRYTNSIQLPQIALLNTKAIKAEMVNGVLKVFVPKLKVEERTDVLLPIPMEFWNNFISGTPFARWREAVIMQGERSWTVGVRTEVGCHSL
ncbi:auxin transporter-like protein 1 [Phtheirospermum japonicum]|uniref:Auxin transporter-like protein 1 n=1 Tax=Phtheirospermum japonicum TaxID=374723 RepID=A0A830DBX7_9LAMI|nr:auxin transporter-like protein 1 [Phtheirospermum japonicum]